MRRRYRGGNPSGALSIRDDSAARAYLDIETAFDGSITIVGMLRPGQDVLQLVGRKVTADAILEYLRGTTVLHTYNGSRFDLPRIREALGLDLESLMHGDDLMYHCWQRNLYGGLKRVEETLGIGRQTSGLNGMDAMLLWARYMEADDEAALKTLLHYNREDVENLVTLREMLNRLAGA